MMATNMPRLSLCSSMSCLVFDFVRYAHIDIIVRNVLLRSAMLSGVLAISCLDVCAGGIEVILKPDVQTVWKVHFVTPQVGVCIALDGLYKTTNGGSTWRGCLELSNDEAINSDCLDVNISSTGIGLYVSGNRMFQTIDTGSTWTELTAAQKPHLTESWTQFFRVYSGAGGDQLVFTNTQKIASRNGVSGEWTYDTVTMRGVPRDAAMVNDTSAIMLLQEDGVEYRTGSNRVRSFPNAPFGYRINADGPLVAIADIDKVWISRDGCETWSKADLQLTACSLAVVKDGCILVIEDNRVHYSSDSGRTWSVPIETGVKNVIAAQLVNCDAFFAFGFFRKEFIRSVSGVGPTVVSVQHRAQTSSHWPATTKVARWVDIEELLLSLEAPVTIVGYNSLGEVILGPTPITRSDGSLDGLSSRLRGQLIWLTVATAKQSKTIVLLP